MKLNKSSSVNANLRAQMTIVLSPHLQRRLLGLKGVSLNLTRNSGVSKKNDNDEMGERLTSRQSSQAVRGDQPLGGRNQVFWY